MCVCVCVSVCVRVCVCVSSQLLWGNRLFTAITCEMVAHVKHVG